MLRSLLFGIALLPGIPIFAQTIPPQLVGVWEGTSTATSTFYDRNTASYAAPSGESQKYTIYADGQYRREALIQSSLYNCTDTVFVTELGNIKIQGLRIIFDSTGADLESRDNCKKSFNYKKHIEPRQRTLGWRVDHDRWGVKLCFSNPGKTDSCYYKK